MHCTALVMVVTQIKVQGLRVVPLIHAEGRIIYLLQVVVIDIQAVGG